MVKRSETNIFVKGLMGVWLIIIIIFIFEWQITATSDASRHLITYKNLKLEIKKIGDFIELHKENGSGLFLIFLYNFKLFFTTSIYELDFKIIQIIISLIFYISIFANIQKIKMNMKEKILTILCSINLLSPLYIFSVMRFPFAVTFFNFGFYFKKKWITLIFFFVGYYIHSGISYLILGIFLVSFSKRKISYKYLISFFILSNFFLFQGIKIFKTSYYINKINSYVVNSRNSGIGIATTILTIIIYIYILYFTEIILKNKKCLYRSELIKINNLAKIFLMMGVLNMIFLFRSLYFIVVFFPYFIINLKYLKNKHEKLITYGLLIIIIVLGILENRYILSSMLKM